MKTTRIITAVLLVLGAVISVQADTVLYADDFNRTASAAIGSTSTGGETWVENEDGSGFNTWIRGSDLELNTDGSGGASGDFTAWVDYDLDSIVQYTVEMDLRISGTSGNAWHKIDPRRDNVDALFDNGWFFRSDGSNIDISFWNGSEVSVAQDVVAINTDMKLVFDVNDNSASLTILDALGTTTLMAADTRTISNAANDSSVDVVGLMASTFAGKAWVDNLVVTQIPEPATLGLLVTVSGGILFIRRKFMI